MARPALTRIFFDPAQRDIFDPRSENLKCCTLMGKVLLTWIDLEEADRT